MNIIPKGATLTISTGEYSDYSVHGVFRAVEGIDAEKLRDEWLTAHPDQRDHCSFEYHEFLADVTRRGLLEAVPSYEWHLADYSCADEMHVSDCS